MVQQTLARLGFTARISAFPLRVLLARTRDPREPWDVILIGGFGPDIPDPSGVFVHGGFRKLPARYERRLRAASTLKGTARYRAYGALDVEIARNVAPMVPFAQLNLRTFLSSRVGCIVFRPEPDLATACLRRR